MIFLFGFMCGVIADPLLGAFAKHEDSYDYACRKWRQIYRDKHDNDD